jgi:hypothetical protein
VLLAAELAGERLATGYLDQGAATSAKKQGGGGDVPPAAKARGDFAEVDDAIESLEQTQRVLNTILDMFSRDKGKKRAKDR